MNFIFALDIINLVLLFSLTIFFLFKGFSKYTITYYFLSNLLFAIAGVSLSIFLGLHESGSISFTPIVLYLMYSFYYFFIGMIFSVFFIMFISLFKTKKTSTVYHLPTIIVLVFFVNLFLIPIVFDWEDIFSTLIDTHLLLMLDFSLFFISAIVSFYYFLANRKKLNRTINTISFITIFAYVAIVVTWNISYLYSVVNLIITLHLFSIYLYLFIQKNFRKIGSLFFLDRRTNRLIENAIKSNSFSTEFLPVYNLKKKKYTIALCQLSLNDEKGNKLDIETILNVANKQGFLDSLEKKLVYRVCKFIKEYKNPRSDIERIDVEISSHTMCDVARTSDLINLVVRQNIDPSKIGFELRQDGEKFDYTVFLNQVSRLNEFGFYTGISNVYKHEFVLSFLLRNSRGFLIIDKNQVDDFLFDKKRPYSQNLDYFLSEKMNFTLAVNNVDSKDVLEKIKSTPIKYACGPLFEDFISSDDFVNNLLTNSKN